jgi:hypothetical protein
MEFPRKTITEMEIDHAALGKNHVGVVVYCAEEKKMKTKIFEICTENDVEDSDGKSFGVSKEFGEEDLFCTPSGWNDPGKKKADEMGNLSQCDRVYFEFFSSKWVLNS